MCDYMENTHKMKGKPVFVSLKWKSNFVWVLILLSLNNILILLEFYVGKPELYRLF